jgi:hypothetical protein
MAPRILRRTRSQRDLLLDGACILLSIVFLVLAATALNHLPYPGSQPYAHRISAVITSPLIPAVPDAIPDALPDGVSDAQVE